MKARIRKTGEIVEIISWCGTCERNNSDNVSYIDSNGNEHSQEKGLNYYWDFEIIDDIIDWEQRRYELAKAAMQGILSNQDQVDYACSEADYGNGKHTCPIAFAQYAVACADALIEELKKK